MPPITARAPGSHPRHGHDVRLCTGFSDRKQMQFSWLPTSKKKNFITRPLVNNALRHLGFFPSLVLDMLRLNGLPVEAPPNSLRRR